MRGGGVWLYDAKAKAYLGSYNNVCSVGHRHPAVVAALAGQRSAPNIHTRDVQDSSVAQERPARKGDEVSVGRTDSRSIGGDLCLSITPDVASP